MLDHIKIEILELLRVRGLANHLQHHDIERNPATPALHALEIAPFHGLERPS